MTKLYDHIKRPKTIMELAGPGVVQNQATCKGSEKEFSLPPKYAAATTYIFYV